MARSYHVTRKAARIARADGDNEPTRRAAAKSWTKKMEKHTRIAQKHVPQEERSQNRSIVGRAKLGNMLDRLSRKV